MPTKNNTAILFLISILLFTLVACGFKLRGRYNLPQSMHSVVISSPVPSSELIVQLKRHIKGSGVEVSVKPVKGEQSYTLKILREKVERRIASVDNMGRASGFEVNLFIAYEFYDDRGEVLVPLKEISLVRDYLVDTTNPLASNEEEKLLLKNMKITAARMIMLGISIGNN